MIACNKTSEPKGKILFTSTVDGNYEIYSMDANGEARTRLTNNESTDYAFGWSPDGKQILYYSKTGDNNEIWRMNEDGTLKVNLTNHPSNDHTSDWSPDGKTIAFTSDRDTAGADIYLMNSDGSNVRRLTYNRAYCESPSWSLDGKQLIFTLLIKEPEDTSSSSNGELHIINIDGTNQKRLTYKKGYDSGADWSPDGKKIAFYGPSEQGNFDIFLMDPDGGNITNLTDDETEDYSPSWSPDGKWITFTSGNSENYDVWIINLSTKEKRRLTSQPKRDETPFWQPR